LREEVRCFRGFGVPSLGGLDRSLSWPNLELGETDKEVRIAAELPGLEEKDVDITVEEDLLTLRGEKKSEVEDKIAATPNVATGTSND
jgi:HSP20 family protein